MPENYVTGQEYVFSWVKRGVTAAVHNIIHGRWTKGSVGAYLEVLGVSDWIINRVKNVWDKNKDGKVGSVEEEAKLIWPELWGMDYDADIFIETPLHLIFMAFWMMSLKRCINSCRSTTCCKDLKIW